MNREATMNENELRAVKPFDALPVESEDAADHLCRSNDPKLSLIHI